MEEGEEQEEPNWSFRGNLFGRGSFLILLCVCFTSPGLFFTEDSVKEVWPIFAKQQPGVEVGWNLKISFTYSDKPFYISQKSKSKVL